MVITSCRFVAGSVSGYKRANGFPNVARAIHVFWMWEHPYDIARYHKLPALNQNGGNESEYVLQLDRKGRFFFPLKSYSYSHLGGGFKHFLFSPLPGEDSHFDYYFSNGLNPPTGHINIDIVEHFGALWMISFLADLFGQQNYLEHRKIQIIRCILWIPLDFFLKIPTYQTIKLPYAFMDMKTRVFQGFV